MGKYDPLKSYLEGQETQTIDVDFAQVEAVLGFNLPNSAYRHQAWWANEAHGSHSHSRSWQDAGWETCQVSTARQTVRFERKAKPSSPDNPPQSSMPPTDDLWEQARKITGIDDRKALIEAALTALIRREAAKGLIALGGTMPDFTVPARERPTW